MKTSDILILAGLGIGGYYLYNQKKTEDTGGGGGGINLDLGGLGGLASQIPSIIGGGGGLGLNDILSLLSVLDGGLGGTSGVTDIINKAGESAVETGNSLIDKLLAITNNPAKTETPTPKGEPGPDSETSLNSAKENSATQSLRQKAAVEVVTVGGAYAGSKLLPWAIKALGPRVAESVGGKIALGASGIGTPIAIGWTVLDLLVTAYEGISGENVAGGWLGYGEILGETSWGRKLGFKKEPVKTSSDGKSLTTDIFGNPLPIPDVINTPTLSETDIGNQINAWLALQRAGRSDVPTPKGQPGLNPYIDIPDVPEVKLSQADIQRQLNTWTSAQGKSYLQEQMNKGNYSKEIVDAWNALR